jgi:hypothetical protein
MATAYDSAIQQENASVVDAAPVVALENVRKTFGSHTVLN